MGANPTKYHCFNNPVLDYMDLVNWADLTGDLLDMILSKPFGKDRHCVNNPVLDHMDLVNWADLTGDPLDLILSKLFGKDRHSFSLVCKPWNAVAANSPYRYSPCLVNYHQRTHTWKFYQYNNFFNMTFPKFENTKLCCSMYGWFESTKLCCSMYGWFENTKLCCSKYEWSENTNLRCSKYGWLLMSVNNDAILFFFDPSNNRKIDLPCQPPFMYKSLCFFSPPTSPECVVVGISNIGTEAIAVGTHKLGEDKWQTINCPYNYRDSGPFVVSNRAPILHRGLIYIMSMKGDVAILDIEQQHMDFKFKCLSLEIEEVDIKGHYLVKVNGEDSLFGVFVIADERKVQVFRLSSDVKWDLVEEGIGDKVLYLSDFSSFGDKAPTKSMENTIYFPIFHGDVAVFYSLRDTKYHSIDEDYSEDNAYGIKTLEHAAWIMPIPAQEVNTSLSCL